MTVALETASVWRGGGRRWFTHAAACRAEAKAFLRKQIAAAGEDGIPIEMWSVEVGRMAEEIAAGREPSFDWDDAVDRARHPSAAPAQPPGAEP